MTVKRPFGIRFMYTPLERALLAAYLQYPDPAPEELAGIDVTAPVDAGEWEEETQGVAPHRGTLEGDQFMLENAVARICLLPVDANLPQWASIANGQFVTGRKNRRRGLTTNRTPKPVHLFTVNWADSAPGFSWPEAYYATRLPGYDVCIVTASADCPDAHGYCDFALGWYLGEPGAADAAGESIRSWWAWQRRENSQQRWAYLFDTAAIDHATAEQWADDVWGADDEDGDSEEAEDDSPFEVDDEDE